MNPQKLTQGQTYVDPAGRSGIVNFDTKTGARLAKGATTGIIDASRLGSATNVTVPNPISDKSAQTKLSTTIGGIGNLAETNFSLGSAEQAAAVQQDQGKKKTGVLDRIGEIIGLQSKQGEKTLKIQEDEGVFAKKAAARKLENDIIAKTRAYDKQAETIRANAQGTFGGAVEQELANLDRQRNSELADLAIQYKVAAGDYNQAFEIAQAKIEAEFEPLKNEIASLTQLYNLQQNDLTESEKMQAQAIIQEKQQQLNFQRDQELYKYKQEIDQANPMFALDLQLKKEQITNARVDRQNTLSTINARNAESVGGGKLTADERKKEEATTNLLGLLGQYRNVIGGLNILSANAPKNKAIISTLRGQIAAEYKQAKQLGTLDAGVERLLNQVIPDPSKIGVASLLSNKSQVAAIDNFISNTSKGTVQADPLGLGI